MGLDRPAGIHGAVGRFGRDIEMRRRRAVRVGPGLPGLPGGWRSIGRSALAPTAPPALTPTPTPAPLARPRTPAMLRGVAGGVLRPGDMLGPGGLMPRRMRSRSVVVAGRNLGPAVRRPTLPMAVSVSQESEHSQAKRGDASLSEVT